MCTQKEIRDTLHEEFFKKDGLKDELLKSIEATVFSRMGRWLLTGGAIFLFVIAGAWFSLQNEVARNSEFRESGFTQDQAALIIQRLDQVIERTDSQNKVIQALDQRLRAKGL